MGFIHIYHGDGKGKTTAAIGLLVRMAGNGKKTAFCQFLKDGSSCEISHLKNICEIFVCNKKHSFYFSLSDDEKEEVRAEQNKLFSEALSLEGFDLIVLDEIIDACNLKLIDENKLSEFLKKTENTEIVLTGRNPSKELTDLAHYITEMKKQKHPFDMGIDARKGIEF